MGAFDLRGRDLITTQEWSREALDFTLDIAKQFKVAYYAGHVPKVLEGKTFFMLFYNTSTRTRASFEAAMTVLGGHAQFIDVSTTRIVEGEAIKDAAKMFERYGHGLGVRVLEKAVNYEYGRGNAVVREYAKHARIPVINMADDMYHPCQGLADIMTLREKLGKVEGKRYIIMWAYSDKARSWCSVQEEILIATRYGMDVVLAHPPGFELDERILEQARRNAEEFSGSFEVVNDFEGPLEGAHAVFPRSWTSHKAVMVGMDKFGMKREIELHRKYMHWRLTMEHVDKMDKHGVVTHVLPVFRGQEADDDVMDSPRSVIYDQAENRLYVQMAVLALTMGGWGGEL